MIGDINIASRQNNQAESQQEYGTPEQCYQPTRPMSSMAKQQQKDLLMCLWNILQDRPYSSHKTSLKTFKITEFIQSMFLGHNGNILEVTNMWKLNDTM